MLRVWCFPAGFSPTRSCIDLFLTNHQWVPRSLLQCLWFSAIASLAPAERHALDGLDATVTDGNGFRLWPGSLSPSPTGSDSAAGRPHGFFSRRDEPPPSLFESYPSHMYVACPAQGSGVLAFSLLRHGRPRSSTQLGPLTTGKAASLLSQTQPDFCSPCFFMKEEYLTCSWAPRHLILSLPCGCLCIELCHESRGGW